LCIKRLLTYLLTLVLYEEWSVQIAYFDSRRQQTAAEILSGLGERR